MSHTQWTRFAAALGVAAVLGCAKGEQAGQPADTTARNLTLAPTESTAAMADVPAPPANPSVQPAAKPKTTSAAREPAPAKPATLTLAAGTQLDISVGDTISSRTTKAGDPFTARVVEDVKDAQGRVVIPAGSTVRGTVAEVKPAPNPSTAGTLTLMVSEITVRGASYPIAASIDSLETVHKGRGVTTGDAAKVGVGAAAGAIAGRILGGNKKGTIIGGVVGAAVGAGVAAGTKDSDIVLPAGAHVVISLTKPLSVKAS